MNEPPESARERGNAAIAVLGAAVVTLLVVAGLADVGLFFSARARAQTAADAAALAAVAELIPGIGSDARQQAGRYASANGARLVECRCSMGSSFAEVKVSIPVDFVMAFRSGTRQITARARADVNI